MNLKEARENCTKGPLQTVTLDGIPYIQVGDGRKKNSGKQLIARATGRRKESLANAIILTQRFNRMPHLIDEAISFLDWLCKGDAGWSGLPEVRRFRRAISRAKNVEV